MATAEETLARAPLFSSLSDKERRKVARELRERRFTPGEQMTSEDLSGIGFFVIGDGNATVSVQGKVKGQLGPGDSFGEVGLLAGRTRSASIVADTDVQCWVLSQWHFKPLVMENPEIAWQLLQILANRVHEAQATN